MVRKKLIYMIWPAKGRNLRRDPFRGFKRKELSNCLFISSSMNK